MINIRDASPADIPVIQEVAEKTWWPTYSPILERDQIRYMLDVIYSAEAIRMVMENGSQQFILLHDERGVQGFASYGVRPEDHRIIKLHKIYVLPDNHGKGYGKMLIGEIKNRAKASDIHTLDLNVNRYNPAHSFYQKMGFRVLREEDIAIGPYWMNDFVMRMEF